VVDTGLGAGQVLDVLDDQVNLADVLEVVGGLLEAVVDDADIQAVVGLTDRARS